jgi:phage tail-like protein
MALASLPIELIEKLDLFGLEVLKRFQFAVSIDGNLPGFNYFMGFNSVTGLADRVDVREVKEGGFNGVHRFPRRGANDSIKLIRGMTFSSSMHDWFIEVKNWTKGKPSYTKTMSVAMLDHISILGQPIQFEVWRFDIINAWPSEWIGPELSADAEELAFECVTIQHGGITKANSMFGNKVSELISVLQ